ncbi:CHAT domain-containing protein [Chondromyces crocatus]|uniref:CHAT domain-containing protein n=1 Tax=Chondromyces crocatus TaxID=52 RepID=A0A0K1ENE6_CHOCO|nr:CHAT domain-containing protein [Chondromyces crocatus]AKT42366.1 uncharacterized protein CMC5_065920 [Chondromyces crocatus]
MRFGFLFLLTTLLAATAACHDPAPLVEGAGVSLTVEASGCSAVRLDVRHDGPLCEIPRSGLLRLWIATDADASLHLALDARPVLLPLGLPARDGVRRFVPIPDAARSLRVTAKRGASERVREILLAPRVLPPALDEAEAFRREGRLDDAEKHLALVADDPHPAVRAAVTGKRARIARSRGDIDRAVALLRDAVRLDREAGRVSDELNDRFALAYTLLYQGRRFPEAREALDGLDDLLQLSPDGRATAAYYRGLLAYETGDLRAALRLFRASAEDAERLGLDDHRIDVLQPWATTLSLLGRHAEAMRLLRQAEHALGPGGSPCRRAHLANDRGWIALRAVSALERGDEDPLPPLEEALALYREACPEPADLANVRTNLALAALERGAPDDALRHLDQARALTPDADPRLRVWWLLLEARIALAQARTTEALAAYERLVHIADGALLPAAALQAALGRAQVFEALHRPDDARLAHAEAEDRIEDASLLVPLGEGRETFLAGHELGARQRIDFLVRHARALDAHGHDPAGAQAVLREAAEAARRSRARLLRALRWADRLGALPPDERARWDTAVARYRRERAHLDEAAANDWKLSSAHLAETVAARRLTHGALREALDEALSRLGAEPTHPRDAESTHLRGAEPNTRSGALPQPTSDEVQLVYHPVREGWVGFAITPERVQVHPLGPIDLRAPLDALAAQLLTPFRERLQHARRVRVAPFGPLEHLDLHTLPWEGAPLIEHLPIVYGLDLSRPPSPLGPLAPETQPTAPPAPPPPAQPPGSVVIVADPRGDLPAARREAQTTLAALAPQDARARPLLLQGPDATHLAVREALEAQDLSLFHYAGHGIYQGLDAWESGLPLAQGGWLTLADIMTLRRAPRRVILSACETARSHGEHAAAGLGLAQAFAVAGSTEILAAMRPVDDHLTERLMGAVHTALASDPTLDLAAALRLAHLSLRTDPSSAHLASFRVLVP